MKTAILVISLVVLTACSSGPILIPDNDKEARTASVERPVAPDRPTPDTPVGKPDKPSVGKPDRDHTKSNASGNNGKGGNYDKTGHTDNGKGKRDE